MVNFLVHILSTNLIRSLHLILSYFLNLLKKLKLVNLDNSIIFTCFKVQTLTYEDTQHYC